MPLVTTLLIAFSLLSATDIVTTIWIGAYGGHESNRFLAGLFHRFGAMPTLLVLKGALIAGLIWFAMVYPAHPAVVFALIFGVGLMVWVIQHNVGQIMAHYRTKKAAGR